MVANAWHALLRRRGRRHTYNRCLNDVGWKQNIRQDATTKKERTHINAHGPCGADAKLYFNNPCFNLR
eukprot:2478923-Lingulodinium_polyedra.AAC.1